MHSYFGDSDVSGLPAKGYSVDIFEQKSFSGPSPGQCPGEWSRGERWGDKC